VAGHDTDGGDVLAPPRDRLEVALGQGAAGDAEQPLGGLLTERAEAASASCGEDDDVGACAGDAVLYLETGLSTTCEEKRA
jgi:hypothetical protein